MPFMREKNVINLLKSSASFPFFYIGQKTLIIPFDTYHINLHSFRNHVDSPNNLFVSFYYNGVIINNQAVSLRNHFVYFRHLFVSFGSPIDTSRNNGDSFYDKMPSFNPKNHLMYFPITGNCLNSFFSTCRINHAYKKSSAVASNRLKVVLGNHDVMT